MKQTTRVIWNWDVGGSKYFKAWEWGSSEEMNKDKEPTGSLEYGIHFRKSLSCQTEVVNWQLREFHLTTETLPNVDAVIELSVNDNGTRQWYKTAGILEWRNVLVVEQRFWNSIWDKLFHYQVCLGTSWVSITKERDILLSMAAALQINTNSKYSTCICRVFWF